MLQCGCKLYVSCSFCCLPCRQSVHLAIWKIHGKKKKEKRKAICALVLKVGIIKPLRFNGYSSWLTNNLLCLHYFVCIFPYEKQRIEKKDQRLQMRLCFERQDPLLLSNGGRGEGRRLLNMGFRLALHLGLCLCLPTLLITLAPAPQCPMGQGPCRI